VKTTVNIDDVLYLRALEVADPTMDRAELFSEALKVFVRIQAAKKLAAMGGAAPEIKDVPRRRSDSDLD